MFLTTGVASFSINPTGITSFITMPQTIFLVLVSVIQTETTLLATTSLQTGGMASIFTNRHITTL